MTSDEPPKPPPPPPLPMPEPPPPQPVHTMPMRVCCGLLFPRDAPCSRCGRRLLED